MDDLGDRMKTYENVTRHYLTRRTPVIVRVDGRAFHTITRKCKKPFDSRLMDAMTDAAIYTAQEMQGFKLAYIQSDEASFLLTDWDTLQTQPWFGNNLSKIISIAAAAFTAYFNFFWEGESTKLPMFDARAFQLPREEVANYFLWRAKDWERNSLQMYCQSLFSHKKLQNKGKTDMHEMLHKAGKNWTEDLDNREKNGTFIRFEPGTIHHIHDALPRYPNVASLVNLVMPKEE